MKQLAIKAWGIHWLTIFLCCWIGQVFAIGETCSQIWTQAVRPSSAVPAWGYCFANHPDCYNVTGATTLNSLPSSLTAGDYFLTGNIANNTNFAATGTTVRIFVNGSLTIGNNVQLNATGASQNLLLVVSGSVSIGNNANINGFILAGGGLSINNNAVINGGITANGAISTGANSTFTYNSSALNQMNGGAICGLGLTCFNDNFQTSSLTEDWVVSRSSGTFTPSIVNGRMRMTQNVGNQSTAASFQRLFPGLANLVIVEFDQFAYGRTGGEGADGMAVVLSDASIIAQPGAFGGPLGYGIKPGIPGFAGGWLGIGIDEYGNYSAEGGPASPGRRRQTVALRGSGSGSTGYRYLAGACSNGTTNTSGSCLSPTVDNNNVGVAHRYKVTIDSRNSGQAMVKVERNSGSGYQTLINNFNALIATGQAPVPTNFSLSLTGSTGGDNNIHELDNLQICALKSEPVGELVDHFELSHSGQALICKAEEITVKACKNPACTELVTNPVSVTLSPATGWISGTGLTGGRVLNFTGGTATASLSQTTVADVVIGVSDSVPLTKPFTTPYLCQKNGTLSVANCKIEFKNSGLLFSVPDKFAAKPVSFAVKAVKSDGSQACVPSFSNVSRNISFYSSYDSPGTPSADPVAQVSISHGVSSSVIGNDDTSPTPIALSFNASGEATIGLNYADAGQLTLNAHYSGSATTNDAGLVLTGADQFVSAPHGICISANAVQSCPTPGATCPVYKKAGEAFVTTFRAHAWQSDVDTNYCDNPVTPSFNLNAIPLSHSLLAPAGGVNGDLHSGSLPGSAKLSSYHHVAQVDAQTPVNMSISEVGIFRLQAGGNLTYLGMPIPLGSSMSDAIARIVPYQFEVQSSIAATCGSFHYLSQPATLAMIVKAVNAAGVVTKNYRQSFAKATVSLVAENNNSGVDLTSRIKPLAAGLSWDNGELVASSTTSLLRAATLEKPFESVLFGLKLHDIDGGVLAGLNQNPATDDDCASAASSESCVSKTLDTAQPWRYGRLQIVNALGSEQSNLPVQIKAEYFNGQQFVPNTLDNCSPVAPARLLVTAGTNPVLAVTGTPKNLSNGSSAAFDLLLSPPGVERPDPLIYPLQYQLDDYEWLQFDWDPTNTDLLENPKGEAVFGGFRGNNRQIFWREN